MHEEHEHRRKREEWAAMARKNMLHIPTEMKNEEEWLVTTPYIFALKGVKGLSLPPLTVGKKYEMRYEVTLFHPEYMFFGRTYGGCPLSLKQTSGTYETNIEDYVFFYTQLPQECFEVVVEIVVYESIKPGKMALPPFSSGWTKVAYLADSKADGKAKTAELWGATPRVLLHKAHKKIARRNNFLEYQWYNLGKINDLKKVIPPNCLCGPADEIPGVIGDRVPNDPLILFDPKATGEEKLKLFPFCQMYINNCVIRVPPAFEAKLLKTFSLSSDKEADVFLDEFRLKIACNNQWDFVNNNKLKNSITMSLEGDLLKVNGIPTIDNVYLHPDIGVFFLLECTIRRRVKGKDSETMNVTLGDLLIPLRMSSSVLQFEPLDIEEAMNTTTDDSVAGSLIWTPTDGYMAKEWGLMLACEISQKQGSVAGEKSEKMLEKLQVKRQYEENLRKELSEKRSREDLTSEKSKIEKPPGIGERKEIFTPKSDYKKRMVIGKEDYKGKEPQAAANQQQFGKATLSFKDTRPGFHKEAAHPAQGEEEAAFPAYEDLHPDFIEEALGKEISRVDQIYLTDQGAKSLFGLPSTNFGIADIEEDKQDTLKANTVFFEFIAFKPQGRFADNLDALPKAIAFSFKFFTFGFAYTEAVELMHAKEGGLKSTYKLELSSKIKNWSNIFSTPSAAKSLRVQFDFDPTSDKNLNSEKLHGDFLRYLAGNFCRIWVWDAKSLIPLGTCTVCLADFLRKRDPMRMVKKEFNVLSEEKEVIGSLQLVLQNLGRKAGVSKPEESEIKGPGAKQPGRGKTKIRSKPLTIKDVAKVPKLSMQIQGDSVYGKSGMRADEERRKAEMVYAYKMYLDTSQKENESEKLTKTVMEDDIHKYRTLSRTLALATMTDSTRKDLTTLPSVAYALGELTFYPFSFTNPYSSDTLFSIYLYDPEAKGEVQLVSDPVEWKHYCKMGGFHEPPDWTMLNEKTRFLLRPKEEVVFLFKIFSLSPPLQEQRALIMTIQNMQTQISEQASKVKLVYKETYYNSCYLFTVPENRSTDIVLNPEIHSSIVSRAKCVKCSNPNVEAKLINNQVYLSFVSPASTEDLKLYVCIYSDEFCYDAICLFYVLVQAYTCFDAIEVAGNRYMQEILFPNDSAAKKMKFHANANEVVKLGENEGKVFPLEPYQSISVPLSIGSNKIGKFTGIVHGINEETSEVLKRWMFRLQSNAPQVTLKFELAAPSKEPAEAEFAYENNALTQKIFEVSSSHPEIVKILQPALVLGPKEVKKIPVLISPLLNRKKAQVMVYITDVSTKKPETLMFTLISS